MDQQGANTGIGNYNFDALNTATPGAIVLSGNFKELNSGFGVYKDG
jgi:hypothetical protein